MAQPDDPHSISRKVLFARLTGEAGDPVPPFDVGAVLRQACDLQAEGKRFAGSEDRSMLEVGVHDGHSVITLMRQRKKGLPAILTDDRRERGITVKADEGVGEKTHAVWMPDGWIAYEYNHFGPRFDDLMWFLGRVPGWDGSRQFRRAAYSNPFVKLGDAPRVTSMYIRLPEGLIPELKQVDESLYETFNSLQSSTDADEVEVTVRRRNGNRADKQVLTGGVFDRLRALVRMIGGSARAKCEVQVVDLRAKRERLVDLLAEQVETSMQVQMASQKHRHVVSESAFAGLLEAHAEMQGELRAATLL